MRYKIIRKDYSDDLEDTINYFVDKGWTIISMPQCMYDDKYDTIWYCTLQKENKSTTTIKD